MNARLALIPFFAALVVACSVMQVEVHRDLDTHRLGGGEASVKKDSAWQHQAVLDRGIEFMLKSQNEDGSFGSHAPQRPNDITLGSYGSLKAFHNASTALCAMALMDIDPSPRAETAARKALEWLIDCPEARRATMAIFYNTWGQLYHIQCFARALQDPRFADLAPMMRKRAAREVVILQGLQSAEGGWGYYDFRERTLHPSGRISTSFTSASVVIALLEARGAGIDVPDSMIELGLDCVERQRVGNGDYLYSHGHIGRPVHLPNRIEGSLTRSQACNYALRVGGRESGHEFLEEGLANLFQHHDYIEIARQRQFPHETWFANAPYYYYYGHFYAADPLDYLPEPQRAAKTLGDLIALTQDEDGSFWDYPLYGYTKAYGTGYGVLIMNACRKHLLGASTLSAETTPWFRSSVEAKETKQEQRRIKALSSPEWRHQEALERAIAYLVEAQHDNGQFGSAMSRRSRDIYLGGSNSLHAFGEATHALAWMGLQCVPASEAVNKALERGLEYMLNAPKTGRVNDHTFYNVWSHSYVTQALSVAYHDPRFAKSREAIMKRAKQEFQSLLVLQAADGGFGYFDMDHRLGPPSGVGSTPFNTATALDVFDAAESMGLEVPKKARDAALHTLQDMRLPSGAYFYSRNHYFYPHGRANQVEGSLGRSQACNLPLYNAGRLTANQLKDSLDDLIQHHDYIEIARQRQLPHETWFANAPYYYYYGHYYASRCIEALDESERAAYAATLADLVAATQDSDGCFWDFPLYDYGKAYGTGYALMILTRTKATIEAAPKSSVASVR
ncbi:MAG: hypothetical protein KDB07_02530 [Planctomycetes bacterium]|nr:hypothetical protein [Planctomycetota bacterium]